MTAPDPENQEIVVDLETRGKKRFYITFTQATLLRNGWTEVWADDEMDARLYARFQFGDVWSGIYTEQNWNPQHFPAGCVGTVVVP